MCGIVGVLGGGIVSADSKVFTQLLQIDTLRGAHSTGVFLTDNVDSAIYKKAVDGYTFTDLRTYGRVLDSTKCIPSLLLGHNRYATMGSINDENAHPFQDGDTTLVHNGSLKTGWENYLHDSKRTFVDSEAICFNVEHEGMKKTVEKLNGAFTLISHDKAEDTVTFVRNDERPMYFTHHKHRDVMYFASEAYMLDMVLTRNNIQYKDVMPMRSDAIITYDLMAKDVLGSIKVDTDVKYFVPPPTDYDNFGYRRAMTPNPMYQMGLSYNEQVAFYINESSIQNNVLNYSKLEGAVYSIDKGEFICYGTLHSVNNEIFPCDIGDVLFCKPSYLSKENDHLSCITPTIPDPKKLENFKAICEDKLDGCEMPVVSSIPKKAEKKVIPLRQETKEVEDDSEDDYSNGFQYMGNDYSLVTRLQFIEQTSDGCAMCASPISADKPEDSWGIIWLQEEFPICEDCSGAVMDEGDSNADIERKLEEALCS